MKIARNINKIIPLLVSFIIGVIVAGYIGNGSVNTFLQYFTLFIWILILFFIYILCFGIYRIVLGKKDYDVSILKSGTTLLFSGATGTILSIVLMFI